MKNNRIKTILKISLPLLVLGIAVAGWGFYYFVQKPNTTVKDNGIIYIRKGDSFETVMQALLSKRYIKNEYTLRQVARLKQYPRLVKAGRYRIQDGMSNNQLVNMLRAGNQEAVPFTFNNIRTLPDFARTANRQLGIDSAAFMSLVKDTLFLDSLGFTPATFIAMFIPNTYQIYWNTSLPAFIKRMHAEYRRFWTPERLEKAGKAGFTPIEISTIASIVEEETDISVSMEVTYTSSWFDETAESEGAKTLISRGAALISQHADSMGAPSACEAAGVPNVSYNGSTEASCPNTFIISSYINWEPYFEYMIDCVLNGEEIAADWTGTLATGSVALTEFGSAAAEGTAEKVAEVRAQLESGELHVFDCSKFTVDGEHLTTYKADVDTDDAFTPDHEAIENGVFYESKHRSAPYFDVRIDGITELSES